jgi:hypothetical protein
MQIPSVLQVPSGRFTVYHTRNLTREEMQKLYDAGFRDVDTLDASGETPFMVVARYMHGAVADVCEWLMSKGASPLKEVTDFGTVQIHYLAAAMANLATRRIQRLHITRQGQVLSGVAFADLKSGIKLISRDANLMVKDHCHCGCSPDGCSPIVVFLRNTLGQVYEDSLEGEQECWHCHHQERGFSGHCGINKNCVQLFREANFFFASYVLEIIYEQQEIPNSAYVGVIRLFLFMELGLTHTCCAVESYLRIGRPKTWDDACEIHEEERELLLDLENLFAEASARRALYHGPFNEFLSTFLLEVQTRPRNRMSEEDIHKIEEIGVVIDLDTIER